jgi:hypothetical protein
MEMNFILVIALASLMIGAFQPSRAGDVATTGASSTQPTTQPVVFGAGDRDGLLKMQRQEVIVEGAVASVIVIPPRVVMIIFKGNAYGDFVGVSFKDTSPTAHDYLQGPAGQALIGKTIRLRGVIDIYHNIPQIRIDDVGQVQIVGDATTAPTDDDGRPNGP